MICLAYLLQFDKANCLARQTTDEYPLARYAAKYWTQHARAAEGDAEAMHQLILQFFVPGGLRHLPGRPCNVLIATHGVVPAE
jgi:hypothetical protein